MDLERRLSIPSQSHEINWNIPEKTPDIYSADEREREIYGTLVLDVDGTLTIPDKKYAVDIEAVDVLAEFIMLGGNIIFNSGAALGRIERTVLNPLYTKLDELEGCEKAKRLFKRIFVMPENGSALLLSKGVSVVENELSFDWFRIHELPVPDRDKLREVIQNDLVPLQKGSCIAGEWPIDAAHRDYILSWKEVTDTLELVEYINREVKPNHPEINWDKIQLKAARTTVDFVHADSGKTISVAWVLQELAGLHGPVIGFGDLGDEFAKVVPTINVNKEKPNEFRRRSMPAMELTGGWELSKKGAYVITGEGPKTKVRCRVTDEEIQVLRDGKGEIIYAAETENGYLTPTAAGKKGRPVEIKLLTYRREDEGIIEVGDAGRGTVWMIRRLLDVGHFDLNK